MKTDPARAHSLAPGNGLITAKYAQDELARNPSSNPNSFTSRLARRALRSDPTAAEALSALGFAAQLREDSLQSKSIFSYSNDLSRRELRPRIWAIEEAVMRGDIREALRNYDIALRTSNDVSHTLYPTLANALSEPLIREELLRILATDPIWKDSFLTYAASSNLEPKGAVALIQEGERIGLKPSQNLRSQLVNSLALNGDLEEAWDFYQSFRVNAHRDRSRDPNFSVHFQIPSVFDWQVGSDPRLDAAILSNGVDGSLDFAVPPNVGGALVSQTQLLPPGTYRLQGRSRGVNQRNHYSQPYWTLTCRAGRKLGRIDVPNSEEKDGSFFGTFIVPKGCRSQILSLIARPTDDIMGVAGQIEQVQLIRSK